MATSASGTPGLDRKALKRPDGFTVASQKVAADLSKHSGGVAALIGILFLIGLGGAYWSTHRDSMQEKGRDALYVAQKTIDTDLTAIAQAKKPAVAPKVVPAAKNPAEQRAADQKAAEELAATAKTDLQSMSFEKLDVDAKLAKGVQELTQVANTYSGSRVGYEAKLSLGDLYFNHGDAAKATPWYQGAVADAPALSDKAIALYALGYSLESAGKPADAVTQYQNALNLGDAGLKGDLLLATGRCYELLNDKAKARSQYDQVISQLSNTSYSKSAEAFKAQLE